MNDFIRRIAPAAVLGAAAVAAVTGLDPAVTGRPIAPPAAPTEGSGLAAVPAAAPRQSRPAAAAASRAPSGPETVVAGDASRTSGLPAGAPADPTTPARKENAPTPATAAAPDAPQATRATSSPPAPQPASPPASATTADCATGATVEGQLVQTRWGPVQVSGVVASGQLCQVHAVVWPDGDRKSASISRFAIPQLDASANEALASGSSFQYVSGATYTSDGYWQSLQSLLDR